MTGITGGSVSASYAYDYQGERIKKTVGGVETGYLYQAEDIVKETSGGIVTDYLHGIGIDDPVYLDRSGAKSYYFGDGLGSIREMTDATGTLQNSYSYGAWGELRASSATVANSYGYTGREFAEEGMYFYRARYMDPGLGRFISEDASQIMNDQNGYRYVNNNPANYSDSYGLYTPLTTEEQKECLATIMEALNLVSKWSKKQCCKSIFAERGCNLSQSIDESAPLIKFGDDAKCKPQMNFEGNKIVQGEIDGYVPPEAEDTGDKSIYICPKGCRSGVQKLARTIIHELMHLCLFTSNIYEEYEYQYQVDFAMEYEATQADRVCAWGKKSP